MFGGFRMLPVSGGFEGAAGIATECVTMQNRNPEARPGTMMMLGIKDAFQTAIITYALVTQIQDPENPVFQFATGEYAMETPPPMNPAEVMRHLADAWEEQIGNEEWVEHAELFKNVFHEATAEVELKNMPETLTVSDILESKKEEK